MKDRASGVYWKTVDLVWSGCVHRAGRGLRRCDRERGHSRFPPRHPSCPAHPARVQGPRGQLQAPSRTPRLGLAVVLGNAQPRGITHQLARKALEPKVAAGQVYCARCGYPIEVGQQWDLGTALTVADIWGQSTGTATGRTADGEAGGAKPPSTNSLRANSQAIDGAKQITVPHAVPRLAGNAPGGVAGCDRSDRSSWGDKCADC